MNEQEMQAATVPTFKTTLELQEYIDSLTAQEHDYGTCIYAMSMAATAAFNHVASKLGVTGFQASCADLDIVRRTRRINGPFMFMELRDALFPQYDLRQKVDEFLTSVDSKQWLKDEAIKNIAESENETHLSATVLAHWKHLAAQEIK